MESNNEYLSTASTTLSSEYQIQPGFSSTNFNYLPYQYNSASYTGQILKLGNAKVKVPSIPKQTQLQFLDPNTIIAIDKDLMEIESCSGTLEEKQAMALCKGIYLSGSSLEIMRKTCSDYIAPQTFNSLNGTNELDETTTNIHKQSQNIPEQSGLCSMLNPLEFLNNEQLGTNGNDMFQNINNNIDDINHKINNTMDATNYAHVATNNAFNGISNNSLMAIPSIPSVYSYLDCNTPSELPTIESTSQTNIEYFGQPYNEFVKRSFITNSIENTNYFNLLKKIDPSLTLEQYKLNMEEFYTINYQYFLNQLNENINEQVNIDNTREDCIQQNTL